MTQFQTRQERYRAGRALARLLRHEAPHVLQVNEYGYASMSAVVYAMQHEGFEVTVDHIIEIVLKDAQQRFEIFRGKIRAKAGHTYPVVPGTDVSVPPEFLYHGTSSDAANQILRTGLLRMGKAYVHLALTIERARRVGLRKSDSPTILRIKAQMAHANGIRFWRSGQVAPDGEIYLSDAIPARFIEQIDS